MISSIELPMKLDVAQRKKYIVKFDYKDKENMLKTHKKSMKFGIRGKEDYVDHQNITLRDKTIS